MAKQAGMGDALYVDGVDLSGDIGSLERINGGNEPLVVTGINRSAPERLGGKLDGGIEFTSFFNDAIGPPAQQHQTLKTLPTAVRQLMYVRGPALGAQAACMVAKQINYDGTRGEDASLVFKTSAESDQRGLTWAPLYTNGKRTDSAATNGAGVDAGAASTFGFRGYVQLFAFTGTSVTFSVQESADNGGGDPYATAASGLAVTVALTAPGAAELASNAFGPFNVERWLRVVTTGTFSNAVFVVAVERFLVTSSPI
jgi:hypothetical protein